MKKPKILFVVPKTRNFLKAKLKFLYNLKRNNREQTKSMK